MTPASTQRLALVLRAFTGVLASSLALSLASAGEAAPVRGPPTCADAWRMIDFAVARHVAHDRLTPDLATRARDLLAEALIADHPWLMAEDIAALKGRAAATSGATLLAERAAGRCGHLDAQLSRVEAALTRAASLFPDPGMLSTALPDEPPEDEPQEAETPPVSVDGLRTLISGDALVEAWRVRGASEWPVARAFGARRALRWLELSRQRLASRGTADLVNAFAHALDPHSRYETEEEADQSDRELNPPIGLLGLDFGDPVPGGMPVVGLHPGSPAARHRGLRVGDVMTAVGATSIADRDADEVSAVLDAYEEAVPLTVARPSGRKLAPPRRMQLVRQVLQDWNMSVTATPQVEQGRRVLVARVRRSIRTPRMAWSERFTSGAGRPTRWCSTCGAAPAATSRPRWRSPALPRAAGRWSASTSRASRTR